MLSVVVEGTVVVVLDPLMSCSEKLSEDFNAGFCSEVIPCDEEKDRFGTGTPPADADCSCRALDISAAARLGFKEPSS